MVSKIIGGILFVIGLLITVGFPNIKGPLGGYQPEGMGWVGIFLGLFLMAAGLYILKT